MLTWGRNLEKEEIKGIDRMRETAKSAFWKPWNWWKSRSLWIGPRGRMLLAIEDAACGEVFGSCFFWASSNFCDKGSICRSHHVTEFGEGLSLSCVYWNKLLRIVVSTSYPTSTSHKFLWLVNSIPELFKERDVGEDGWWRCQIHSK